MKLVFGDGDCDIDTIVGVVASLIASSYYGEKSHYDSWKVEHKVGDQWFSHYGRTLLQAIVSLQNLMSSHIKGERNEV